jgi:hypothetical protein
MSSADQVERFIAIVGLPRSGTTVLTALLDAHPAIGLYYEPWNSAKRVERPKVPSGLGEFCTMMEERFAIPLAPGTRITGFKETTILPESIGWAAETVRALSRETPTRVIWIWRDPIHCLFSKLEGARKWWGYPEAHFSRDSLEGFLREAEPSVSTMRQLVEQHQGILLRYETMVRDPASVLGALMPLLGEQYSPRQLEYHQAGARPEKVMGDPDVATNPQPIHPAQVARREEERRRNRALIDETLALERFSRLREEFARLDALDGVKPAGSAA